MFPDIFLLKKLITSLLLPPTGLVLLGLLGLILSRKQRSLGNCLIALSLLSTVILALPNVADALLAHLEISPPIRQEQLKQTQAIVILGGGTLYRAPEYGGQDTVKSTTLVRLRYGAKLAKISHLPVLVTGGSVFGETAEAISMQAVLENEFLVPVKWVEDQAQDTADNARLSAAILKKAGITRIALVTHAWHMQRAIELFRNQGVEVFAAPTNFSQPAQSTFAQWLPSAEHFARSQTALHEMLGRLANRLSH
jgi:uncharacterized SAM-binding protein YcdF (DUF218 family)